ncbi:MAG: hypothetical protein ACT4PS_11265 [Betaproteobacteria bacterium]
MDAKALNLSTEVTGFGRFLFVRLPQRPTDSALARAVESLGSGFENAHFIAGHPTEEALQRGRLQYVRVESVVQRDVADAGMSQAHALVRLEGRRAEPLVAYEEQLRALISGAGGEVASRSGVQKPRSYTSHAMTQYAYAHAVQPAPGTEHPFAVVTPQSKTSDWWSMDWMRRESFFLPQYDEDGNMIVKGHALACDAGIRHLNRRLFHHAGGYGSGTGYDFIGYFEFAASSAPVFREVMASLRDAVQNPEWKYVREGPEWWGRRVGHVEELWPVA